MNTIAGTFRQGVAVTGLGVYLKNRVSGDAVTAGTATGYVTIDNGNQNPISVAPAHKARGEWTFNLTAGEMGGKVVAVQIEHPEADTVHLTLSTQPGDIDAIAGDETAASNLAAGARQLTPFTVGPAPTSTSIPTNISGAPFTTTDHFEGSIVQINQERRRVYGSSGSPVVLTTAEFQSVPSQNDPGVIC